MASTRNNAIAASDWIIDSGATDHIYSQKAYFKTLRPLRTPITVRMGNGATAKQLALAQSSWLPAYGRTYDSPTFYWFRILGETSLLYID
jgi:hypothetical protein